VNSDLVYIIKHNSALRASSAISSYSTRVRRITVNYKSSLGMGIGVASDDRRQVAPNITPVPPPSIKELVETHQSRFN
jgi:hypothetical protein